MPLAIPDKPNWKISVALAVVIVCYLGWVYSKALSTNELSLASIWLADDQNVIARQIAGIELHRRLIIDELEPIDHFNNILILAFGTNVDTARALEEADELLADGLDINFHSSMGMTPLHNAILSNNAQAARYLLERCADPSVVSYFWEGDTTGLSALEFAYSALAEKSLGDRSALLGVLEDPQISQNCKSVGDL